MGVEQAEGTFENGGKAEFDTNAVLNSQLLTSGDAAKFTVKIDNSNNISIKYRVVLSFEEELASGLVSKALFNNEEYSLNGGATKWFGLEANADIPDVEVEIALPVEDRNEYQDKTAKFVVKVEAVQGNAETVDEWNGTVDTAWYAEDTSGAVAGYFQFGTIENVNVTGNVKISGAQHKGGIVGNGYYVNLYNCSVIANEGSYIECTGKTQGSMAGGIAGYHAGRGSEMKNCTVKNLTISALGGVGVISGIEGGNNVVEGCYGENVTLVKTSSTTLPSVGLVCGCWDGNATNPVTLTNNTFKNISIDGQYKETVEYEYNVLFGTGYAGGLINSGVILNNNTFEKVQSNLSF